MITGLCLHRTAKCTLLIRSVDHDITTFGFLTTRKIVHPSLSSLFSVSVSSSFCSFLLLFSALISFDAYRLKPASYPLHYTLCYKCLISQHTTTNVHNKFLSLAKVKYHIHTHNNNINELMKGFFHVPKISCHGYISCSRRSSCFVAMVLHRKCFILYFVNSCIFIHLDCVYVYVCVCNLLEHWNKQLENWCSF